VEPSAPTDRVEVLIQGRRAKLVSRALGSISSWVVLPAVFLIAIMSSSCTGNPIRAFTTYTLTGKKIDVYCMTVVVITFVNVHCEDRPDYWATPDPPAPQLGGTPPYEPFLLRQPNCSLTRIVLDANFTVQEQDASYQDTLHQVLHVPTTAERFPNGCKDPTTGVASQGGAVVGNLPGNETAVATISPDGAFVVIVNSSGSILSQQDYSIGSGTVYGLASADLNGDRVPDIVVASEPNASTTTFSVLLGNGDGTFRTGQALSMPLPALAQGLPTGVTIDDVNRDGKLDLIAVTAGTSTSSGITVFLGNGDGTFPTSGISGPNGAGGIVAVTADFNGDGKKDIATSFGQILLGNGDGTFQLLPQMLPEGQQAGLAAADFNQDGKVDLAFTNGTAATVDVYFGNGDGSFTYSASYPTPSGATTIEASDIDGDGFPDVFVGTANGGVYADSQFSQTLFQSLLNYGDGTFGPNRAYFPGLPSEHFDLDPLSAYTQFATANFTGSGKPDLLMLANGTSSAAFSVLKGNGDGTFHQTAIQTQLGNPSAPQFISAIASGDMNGDGKPDMVFAWGTDTSGTNPHISVALGNGDGTFQAQQDYVLPAAVLISNLGTSKGMVLADLRGTGNPDVAFISGSSLYVMLNNGVGSLGAPILVDSRPSMNYLAAGSRYNNPVIPPTMSPETPSSISATGMAPFRRRHNSARDSRVPTSWPSPT
jgi:hypothetical protein